MDVDERRGLGLLIALTSSGCLGLPRYTEDDGAGDDAGDGPGPTTAVVDEGPEPEGTEDGPDGPVTTSVDDAESFLFMPDIGPSTTAVDSDVTTEPPPDVCQAYSAFIGGCYGEEYGESSLYYCVQYLDYLDGYLPECLPLFEEYLVCISELACGDLSSEGFCEAELQKFSECRNG